MSKTENERNRIKDEFDEIQSESGEFDISKHLARSEDLPDLGEIEIYDYDSDMTVATQQSMEVLESLIDLYLSDVPQLKEHPYIINKIRENSKFSSTQRTELEKFYKGLRKDLGLNEIENPEVIRAQNIAAEESAGESTNSGEIMDNRKLNDLIKNAMINKEKDK